MSNWTPERVKALRQAKGYTQMELAATLKIQLVTVQHWEQGRKGPNKASRWALLRLEQEATEVES